MEVRKPSILHLRSSVWTGSSLLTSATGRVFHLATDFQNNQRAGDIGEQRVELVDIRRAKPALPFFQAREQIRGHWFELITEPGRAGGRRRGGIGRFWAKLCKFVRLGLHANLNEQTHFGL